MSTLDLCQPQIRIHLCGAVAKHTADQVGRQLQGALAEGEPVPLWIDMSRVEFIDSTGLAVVLTTCALAKQRGQAVVLYEVSAPVRLVLELTGLDRHLTLMTAAAAEAKAN
ncbi:STAS domain-containing protein [Nodosilinea sp. PGN35]|uniref:STAS domain-containing protein n=1 Tax=Nodosilinea sp. PGN35 TaxID=3020489 RepID=UPI0023B2A497|nr:STAS domain-containing protein [Nodosilinea sp. TSF1-S3]MDF0367028.1 STAS domain-containing protein [Nodosilinea sp. TSF1-S3]